MTDSISRDEIDAAAKVILQESLQRATAFMQQFIYLPDHVAVIIATSKMDDLLGSIIRQRLLPCPEKSDDFLDSERGVGTFSNKIVMAHRVGIIDASLASALHILRKIRNDFAHTYEGQSLAVPPHSDRIAELSNRLSQHPRIVELRQNIGALSPSLTESKLNFTIVATTVIAKLELAIAMVRPVDSTATSHIKFP